MNKPSVFILIDLHNGILNDCSSMTENYKEYYNERIIEIKNMLVNCKNHNIITINALYYGKINNELKDNNFDIFYDGKNDLIYKKIINLIKNSKNVYMGGIAFDMCVYSTRNLSYVNLLKFNKNIYYVNNCYLSGYNVQTHSIDKNKYPFSKVLKNTDEIVEYENNFLYIIKYN